VIDELPDHHKIQPSTDDSNRPASATHSGKGDLARSSNCSGVVQNSARRCTQFPADAWHRRCDSRRRRWRNRHGRESEPGRFEDASAIPGHALSNCRARDADMLTTCQRRRTVTGRMASCAEFAVRRTYE